MPFCEVSKYQPGRFSEGISIFYKQYGHGDIKVLLIIGLAGTHDSWYPQIKGLTGVDISNEEKVCHTKDKDGDKTERSTDGSHSPGFLDSLKMPELWDHNKDEEVSLKNSIQVCSLDNRGVGQSSVPKDKSYYTTTIMARDALALLDHLGWDKAHVCGHSMGAMIAFKLAAIAPNRILSLALLNTTGGGFQCLPKVDCTMLSIMLRFLKARTPEARADVDLDTHYTKEFLEAYVGSVKRRAILYQEYVKNISASGMQQNYGFEGHINACWTHQITSREYEIVQNYGFLVAVIHGRHDIIAQVRHARQIAKKLYPVARMIELHGGHLVSNERPEEVNHFLLELIKSTESNLQPREWVNLSHTEMGSGMHDASSQKEEDNFFYCTAFFYDTCRNLQACLFYLLGLFVSVFEYVKGFFLSLRKEKIEPFGDHTSLDDSNPPVGTSKSGVVVPQ